MKPLYLFIFIATNFVYSNVKAQCNFFDDYTTSTGWTQVSSEVEIINGKVHFINGAKCREFQKRLHKPLGRTIDENDCWEVKFEFKPSSVGSKNNLPYSGHVILGLTAGTNSFNCDCPDPPCTGRKKGNQDGFLLNYSAQNPPNGDLFFHIIARDSINLHPSQRIIANSLGATYFITLAKAQKNQVQLSVYSDSGYTNHLPGSPVMLTYPGNIDGLTHVQHGNTINGELRRELTGTLDNVCIKWHDPMPSRASLSLPKDTQICAGDSIVLNAGMGSQLNYLWSTGSMDSIISINKAGKYYVRISNGCLEISDTIEVIGKPALTNQLEDITFCNDEAAFLSYRASDVSLLWSTGETSSTIYPTQNGLYWVEVTNVCDTIYEEAFVDFKNCTCDISLPNVFTPNNDGTNDYFKALEISTECVINLSIFNRWGMLVFETTNIDFEWDGGDVADGVYFWVVDYTNSKGSSHSKKKGTVTIIR
ncbi:gliding motility-associated C-terminal domain-containing protein [Owenweeksia hongkongensis]|uniref:gliding motility-associated C-terminal domain-containing protein n=1 Tax=Owenweeksia hongkongensis TaxID=253245 RepID=UPI003A8C9413